MFRYQWVIIFWDTIFGVWRLIDLFLQSLLFSLPHLQRDAIETGRNKYKKEREEGPKRRETEGGRGPFSAPDSIHVRLTCVSGSLEGKRESKRGRKESRDEKCPDIPEEQEETADPVAHWQRLCHCERSAKALFRDRCHRIPEKRSMAARKKEESTRQRCQANARERDRTHRWRTICETENYIFTPTWRLSRQLQAAMCETRVWSKPLELPFYREQSKSLFSNSFEYILTKNIYCVNLYAFS